MLINDVRETLVFILNKTQGGGYLSPTEFNTACRAVQNEIIEEKVEQAQHSQKNMDALRLVTKVAEVSTNSNGEITYPTDYWHYLRLSKKRYEYDEDGNAELNWKPVKRVTEGELALRLDSDIVNPTDRYPIAVFYDSFIRVYPKKEITNGYQFAYIKEPADPTWAYTTSSGVPVFDSGNAVDFSLPTSMLTEVTQKMLQHYGVNLREQEVVAYAQMLKQMNNDKA